MLENVGSRGGGMMTTAAENSEYKRRWCLHCLTAENQSWRRSVLSEEDTTRVDQRMKERCEREENLRK